MGALRAGGILAGFALLTLPLMPVQAVLKRTHVPSARRFPHWYHRQVCRLLGIRFHIEGAVSKTAPVLIVANHTSWLDIPVISAIAPVSFIAKKEVDGWPGVKFLARLQRTVFVDRERRTKVGATASELVQRLTSGDSLVLFAEGTSSDGNRVLPFRSSLFAAAKPTRAVSVGDEHQEKVLVQTLTLAYTRLHGVPISRAERPLVGWYGDMEMLSHALELLKAGPLDVQARISEPIELQAFEDRKSLARDSEHRIRESFLRMMRGREDAVPATPQPPERNTRTKTPEATDGTRAKPRTWV